MFALMIFGRTVGATVAKQGNEPTQSTKKIKEKTKATKTRQSAFYR
jgi:hypothetical protein